MAFRGATTSLLPPPPDRKGGRQHGGIPSLTTTSRTVGLLVRETLDGKSEVDLAGLVWEEEGR